MKSARRKFAVFTKSLWVQEVTEDEIGTLFDEKIYSVLRLEKLYSKVKNNYDILYKEINFEKEKKSTIIMIVILAVSLILNFVNFFALFKS